MDFETMKKRVVNALNKLRDKDFFLLKTNANERTISHKFAEYLQEEFSEWIVDCEYNRHGEEIKRIDLPSDKITWDDTEAKTVFPDIVVHKRNTDNENLLIIEIKKSSNKINHQFDKKKIEAFTKEPYNYKIGLFIEIDVNDQNDSLEWYKEGELIYETKK